MQAARDGGSFRDPAGHVYEVGDRIYRSVHARALDDYTFLRDSGFLARAIEQGWIVGSRETRDGPADANGALVLEHERIPFVSYPYEWSFPTLKAAALFHLDLQLAALDAGVALSDASAYNVQFVGVRPKFIDVLSLRRYRDGEFWLGHRQFCEQFLNPLLLRSELGIPFNPWYRGSLEGIPTADVARLLPKRKLLSWNILSHVFLQAKMQREAHGGARTERAQGAMARRLPLAGLRGMLGQLRRWIARLAPADTGPTVWGSYADANTYAGEEATAKRDFVAAFAREVKPRLLWDLGCNTGAYSAAALGAGAQYVVGFDFDHGALERAYARAEAEKLDFLPLFLDAANPSPFQGWRGLERKSLQARASADAIVALAFEHHLAIGRNVPLPQVVSWLCELAPRGVIEFVRKEDPTIQQMLALREDIFPDYTQEAFEQLLRTNARIVRSQQVSSAGRTLYWYDRS